jgi:hypothetical protein
VRGKGTDKLTLAVCFGQFGPYHHARVAALQRLVWKMGDGSLESGDSNKIKIQQRISKESYLEKVSKMLEHIHRGDIYEANFCMEFYSEEAQLLSYRLANFMQCFKAVLHQILITLFKPQNTTCYVQNNNTPVLLHFMSHFAAFLHS